MKHTPPHKKKKIDTKGAKMNDINKNLEKMYFEGGITYTQAGQLADCSRQHASLMFKKFGDEIVQFKEKDEDWITKNDRVRDRALEGLSTNVRECDNSLASLEKRFKKTVEIQNAVLPDTVAKLQQTKLGEAIEHLKTSDVFAIFKIINTDINLWKNFGYLIEMISSNFKAERTLKAELQQQYDFIEILPPPSEVLDRVIERRIAQKLKLAPALPELAKVTVIEKGKKKKK